MNRKIWLQYIIWILIAEAVGALSGLLSMEGMQLYDQIAVKPAFTPPNIVFPIAWTILYALMGISAARVWLSPPSQQRSRGLNLFVIQLIFNFFWSLIFFNAQAYGFAAIWLGILWVLVAGMIMMFYKTDKIAALIQIPYLLWLTFALILNIAVWMLNS